ncbi:MAG: type I restriction enzyme HsdR N-terminal domain-containing protein [Saprospiraceae bacterium]|nr:type I restriction enzyme HsdR N-terminal domain-containing protein [Saprospiraceae bacterium]
MLIECKAPEVLVNQTTFDQIAMYNMKLEAPYLIVTNGVKTYFCKNGPHLPKVSFFDQVPLW